MHIQFVKAFRYRRFLQVDMGNELLTLFIPEMFAGIRCYMLAKFFPAGLIHIIRSHFLHKIEGDDKHGIVVDIDRWVRQFIHITTEIVVGLHVAPVCRHGSVEKAILFVITFLHQIVDHSDHTIVDGAAGYHFVQDRGVAGLADILSYDMDQGRFLVCFDCILESDMVGRSIRIIRMIVTPVEVCFQDISVYHLVVWLLQGKKQQDRIAQIGRVAFFAGHFNKGIHIARPYLGVTASGIKTAADYGTGHTVDGMKTLVGQDIPG